MSFIDQNRVNASVALQRGHYTFPRAAKLREVFENCLHDYYVKASIGGHFEARGLLVTGESRVGKTSETARLVEEFNASMYSVLVQGSEITASSSWLPMIRCLRPDRL